MPAQSKQHYQKLTFNLTPAQKRYETLEGRQYLVVPFVGLTEGVHKGSQGSLLYLGEELAKNPVTDNHRPAVVYHPMMNGEGISATDPDVMERQKIGITMRAKYDGRRGGEVWVDETKLMRVDKRVYDAIHNNQKVEVSTGLYHDLEEKSGDWNGEHYDGIVRNMVLDHLAILPDQVGACSIEKGAGLLVNAGHELSHNDVMDHLHSEHNKTNSPYGDSPLSYRDRIHISDVFPKHVVYEKDGKNFKHEYKVKNGKAAFHGEPEQVHRQTSYVTANGEALIRNDDSGPLTVVKKPKLSDMSEEMRRQQFQKTLSDKLAGAQQGGEWGGWVQAVLANHVVWSKDGKLFRLPYTYDDDKINYDGDPEEVEKVAGKESEYRRKAQAPSIDGSQSPPSINFSLEIKTMPPTPEELQTMCRKYHTHLVQNKKMDPEQARMLIQNTIHAGAHQIIHDAVTATEANAPTGKADGEARTVVSGGRKESVDKLISSGKYGESARDFLMSMPADDWHKVSGDVVKGATQALTEYSYAGIGDRSNVHNAQQITQNQNAQPANFEQWLAQQPKEMRPVLLNMAKVYGQQKQQFATIVLNSGRCKMTKEQLLGLEPEMLEQMASLVGIKSPTQNGFDLEAAVLNAGQSNYAGAGGEVVFNLGGPADQTQNVNAEILALPQHSWLDDAKTA